MLAKVTRLAIVLVMLCCALGSQSCHPTGHQAFHKKKYKIRKNGPPVQTYYSRGSVFDKRN